MIAALFALIASVLAATPAQAISSTGTGGQFVPFQTHLYSSVTANSKLAANTWRTIPIAGVAGVPSDGSASAVQLTFTTFNQAAAGKLYADRSDAPSPNTALPYQTYTNSAMTNSAVLALGSDGNIQVDPTTATDLIVDITGYFTSGKSTPGGFVPLDPVTRSGAPNGPVNANLTSTQSTTFTVTGGSVPANASAVVLDVIAYPSDSTANGWAQVQPYGNDGTNGRAQLNWPAGQNYAWTTIVALPASANGQVTLSMGPRGSVRFQVGIEGYFTAGTSATNTAFTPGLTSVLDTRSPSSPLAANGVIKKAQVAGVAGVPSMASGITAVAVNLEIFPGAANGHIQISSDAMAGGTSLDQSYVANQPTSVFEIVKLGSDGGVNLQNTSTAAANVKIDVEGWYVDLSAPQVSCPTPYTNGSTTQAMPTTAITCTISAPAAMTSADQLQYGVDVDLENSAAASIPLSATTRTQVSVQVQPTGGLHEVWAVSESPNQEPLELDYTFELGDWSTAGLNASPSDGETTTLIPNLDIQASSPFNFPDDAQEDYFVSTDAGGSNVVWSGYGDGQNGAEPQGLSSGNYYWWAVISGTVTPGGPQTTIVSPTYSFVASDDAAGAGVGTTDAASAADWSVDVLPPTSGDTPAEGDPGTSATPLATYAAVPNCKPKDASTAIIKHWSRAGKKNVVSAGHADLRCGIPLTFGMRHTWASHGDDWERIVNKYPIHQTANQFFMNSAATVLLTPANISYRSANDTYQYSAPIQIIYNNKVYRTYNVLVSVSNGSWNIVTCIPQG